MKTLIFIMIIFLSAFSLQAQSVTNKSIIIIKDSDYYIGDYIYPQYDINKQLKKYPSSKELYDKSYNQKITGGALLTGAGLSFCIGLYQTLGPETESKSILRKPFFYYMIALGASFAAIKPLSNSGKTYRKAIDAYNKEVLNHSSSGKFDLELQLGLTAAGIKISF